MQVAWHFDICDLNIAQVVLKLCQEVAETFNDIAGSAIQRPKDSWPISASANLFHANAAASIAGNPDRPWCNINPIKCEAMKSPMQEEQYQSHHMILPQPYWLLNSYRKNTAKTPRFTASLKRVVQIIFSMAVQRFSSRCTPSTSMLRFLFSSSKQYSTNGIAKYRNSTSSEKHRYRKQLPSHRMNFISFSSELTICLKRKWKAKAQARQRVNLSRSCFRMYLQIQKVQCRLSSTMNGCTNVYFSTNRMERARRKRQAAREWREMQMRWKKAQMLLRYSPRVMGRLQRQKRDRQSSWLGCSRMVWCLWSPNTSCPLLYTFKNTRNSPTTPIWNRLCPTICHLLLNSILTMVRKCLGSDLGTRMVFLWSLSTRQIIRYTIQIRLFCLTKTASSDANPRRHSLFVKLQQNITAIRHTLAESVQSRKLKKQRVGVRARLSAREMLFGQTSIRSQILRTQTMKMLEKKRELRARRQGSWGGSRVVTRRWIKQRPGGVVSLGYHLWNWF